MSRAHHPEPLEGPEDEKKKKRQTNGCNSKKLSENVQMMDFINDHLSIAYICFKGLAGGQPRDRAVFKSAAQREISCDEILVSLYRKVNVTHRTC